MKALEIENLTKTYDDGTQAVSDLSLSIEQGDFFALLGPNGAGKSTTINIICHLVNKTSGNIKVLGKSLDEDPDQVKRNIGLVPQEFNFNIFEKVIDIVVQQAGYYGIPRKEALVKAEKYLKQLGLWEKRNSKAMTLSGGMKRKLMIVRALLHEPNVLILDEPTAGVDVETRREMWAFITGLNKEGRTVILTTHYLEEAEQLCNTIAIIHKGRLIKHTSMKKLLTELKYESFILDLKNELTEPPLIESIGMHLIDATTLQIDVPKGYDISQVFSDLREQSIEVISMRNKSNRLEELFIEITNT